GWLRAVEDVGRRRLVRAVQSAVRRTSAPDSTILLDHRLQRRAERAVHEHQQQDVVREHSAPWRRRRGSDACDSATAGRELQQGEALGTGGKERAQRIPLCPLPVVALDRPADYRVHEATWI